jgi:hypothetical protein
MKTMVESWNQSLPGLFPSGQHKKYEAEQFFSLITPQPSKSGPLATVLLLGQHPNSVLTQLTVKILFSQQVEGLINMYLCTLSSSFHPLLASFRQHSTRT